MSVSNRPPLVTIPPEIEAEMTPAVKAFVLAAFARFEARISELEAQVRDHTQEVQDLTKQVADLASKTPKATPNNSSVPSSTVHPHNDRDKPRNKKSKSKRKRGGQKGHRKHTRDLVPPE